MGYYRILVITLIVLGITPAMAQSSLTTIGDFLDPGGQNTDLLYNQKYGEIKGSPYLFEDWTVGDVKVVSGAVLEKLDLKFDLFGNDLVVNSSGDAMLIAKAAVDEFTLKDPATSAIRTFKLMKRTNGWQFMEILHAEDIYLLKLMELSIATQNNNAGGYAADTKSYQEFTKKVSYFLTSTGKDPVRIKTSKSSVLALLNDREKELSKYIKSQRLKLSKEQDLLALIKYYDTFQD